MTFCLGLAQSTAMRTHRRFNSPGRFFLSTRAKPVFRMFSIEPNNCDISAIIDVVHLRFRTPAALLRQGDEMSPSNDGERVPRPRIVENMRRGEQVLTARHGKRDS